MHEIERFLQNFDKDFELLRISCEFDSRWGRHRDCLKWAISFCFYNFIITFKGLGNKFLFLFAKLFNDTLIMLVLVLELCCNYPKFLFFYPFQWHMNSVS